MGHDKNLSRSLGRFDAKKLGLVVVVACCVVILAYLVSETQPSAFQETRYPYEVRIKQPTDGTGDKIQKTESKKLPEDLQAKDAEHVVLSKSPASTAKTLSADEKDVPKQTGDPLKPICDLSGSRSDFCDMEGDVRMHGRSLSAVYVTSRRPLTETTEWHIKPYARKMLPNIKEVSVKLSDGLAGAPQCTVNYSVPAVVFANGGFTGNYYHDYIDVIVPLFTTARQFYGEVQFLVSNIQGWWTGKYKEFLQGMSKYELIDFDNDDQVRCFPHAIVGLMFHNDLTIDPARAPKGLSMVDFAKFMRDTYSLKRDTAINLRETPDGKPRLLIIARHGTRKFTNAEEIAEMARGMGYDVVVTDPKFGVNVPEFASKVNTFDVMMGVHGAGLTNLVFLPTDAVLIQVVPWGKLENMAKYDFGFPSTDAKLHYLEYSISEEESTLMELYPRDHAVFTDPMAIHRLGWDEMAKIYLLKQNVRLDVNRFRPVLEKARQLLHR